MIRITRNLAPSFGAFSNSRSTSTVFSSRSRTFSVSIMSEAQIRPHPESEATSPDDAPPEKKPRLDSVLPALQDNNLGLHMSSDPDTVSVNPPIIKFTHSQMKKGKRKDKKQKHLPPEPYSAEDVVAKDVATLLGEAAVTQAVTDATEWDPPFEQKEEVELVVSCLSSTGESLAIAPSPRRPWAVVTPLALPGEIIRARVYRHSRLHSYADLLEVVKPNPELRDMTRVQCKYFGKCAGCQYQMLSYDIQLDLKRNVIVKAYQNFSDLPPASIPPILSTIASPLQYGYRTKITPHFEAPPKQVRKVSAHLPMDGSSKPEWLRIGFNQIGTRRVMDIEECPIATSTLNNALGPLREDIIKNIYSYKKGVSLLLRDSLEIPNSAKSRSSSPESSRDRSRSASPRPLHTINGSVDSMVTFSGAPSAPSPSDDPTSLERHFCVKDHKATVRELVGDKVFEYIAGSFFQNNNSVLLPLTFYVRDAIFSEDASARTSPQPTHLVDAYCGSGLFAISLASAFEKVAGIELSTDSIRFATRNAKLNNLHRKCTFMAGDASDIFATVQDFPREKTVLVIDPPRKGTDEKFIDQLLKFNCATVVYVSCNVHTQARDVGVILQKSEEIGGRKYVLESLRGFDLFPQTAHVESVAVLRLL
ncbi:hypothetical protein AcW1_000168 [Taiwanofungus camphoratus]|nr:hypothetical protein AcW2_001338 [Antrodia cinnamomea]KAI0935728.1 hypothetical protein AcV5_004065 [Antrodia cinnamomea]KAI0962950.1 hypothetical protein AcW1_000168 [Antrodia cinnamomea]